MTGVSDGTIDHDERRRTGQRLYQEIMGVPHPEPTSPRSAAVLDFLFAEIWARPGLTRRARRLISLTSLAGADAWGPVGDHLYGALVTGDLNGDELDEWVLHFAVYCGWGKAELAERALDEQRARVASERGELPPVRAVAPVATVPADQELRRQGGEQEFRDVNHAASPPRGVPYYENGIINFVFGEMWKRPVLSRKDRRWITLASVALDDTMFPIRSHVYSAMKSGDCSFDEMRELVLQFAAYSGWPKAAFLQVTVDEEHARVQQEAGA